MMGSKRHKPEEIVSNQITLRLRKVQHTSYGNGTRQSTAPAPCMCLPPRKRVEEAGFV